MNSSIMHLSHEGGGPNAALMKGQSRHVIQNTGKVKTQVGSPNKQTNKEKRVRGTRVIHRTGKKSQNKET